MRPWGVAINDLTNRLYVVNYSSATLLVLDRTTYAPIATIPVPVRSAGIAINTAANLVYVANSGGSTVTVIDGATNTVLTSVGLNSLSFDVAVHQITGRIYATEYLANTIAVIDPATNTVSAHIPVGTWPLGVDVRQGDGRVYVTNSGSNTISVINGATSTVVRTVPVGFRPNGVAVHQLAHLAYVANYGSSTVSVVGHDTVAPNWPSGSTLTASSITMTSVTVEWSAASDAVQVTQYLLYKRRKPGCDLLRVSRSYTFTGLTAGLRLHLYCAGGRWGRQRDHRRSFGRDHNVDSGAGRRGSASIRSTRLGPNPLSAGRANGLIAKFNAALNRLLLATSRRQ